MAHRQPKTQDKNVKDYNASSACQYHPKMKSKRNEYCRPQLSYSNLMWREIKFNCSSLQATVPSNDKGKHLLAKDETASGPSTARGEKKARTRNTCTKQREKDTINAVSGISVVFPRKAMDEQETDILTKTEQRKRNYLLLDKDRMPHAPLQQTHFLSEPCSDSLPAVENCYSEFNQCLYKSRAKPPREAVKHEVKPSTKASISLGVKASNKNKETKLKKSKTEFLLLKNNTTNRCVSDGGCRSGSNDYECSDVNAFNPVWGSQSHLNQVKNAMKDYKLKTDTNLRDDSDLPRRRKNATSSAPAPLVFHSNFLLNCSCRSMARLRQTKCKDNRLRSRKKAVCQKTVSSSTDKGNELEYYQSD